jgi:DNA-cytosine methyltransferase
MPSPTLIGLIGGLTAATVTKYIEWLNLFKKGQVKSKLPISYVSLFSGIGGFELGIKKVFPFAKCVAFAEIQEQKIQVYKSHFPDHNNLGNVNDIPIEKLKTLKADLLVGGFSCVSKSSLSVMRGKTSDQSFDTFEATLRILKNGEFSDIVLENVPTSHSSDLTTEQIVEKLKEVLGQKKKVYVIEVNGCNFTGTARNRVFFTTFRQNISIPNMSQRFEFNLDPYEEVRRGFKDPDLDEFDLFLKEKNITKVDLNPFEYRKFLVEFMNREDRTDRWSFTSDTNKKCSATLTKKAGTYPNGFIIDRRGGDALVRYMTIGEGERLMGFPEGWLSSVGPTTGLRFLGDAVVVPVIQYIMLNYLYERSKDKFKVYKPYKSYRGK